MPPTFKCNALAAEDALDDEQLEQERIKLSVKSRILLAGRQ